MSRDRIEFNRRRSLGLLAGGFSAAASINYAMAADGPASPTNPKFVYSFNPRGLDSGTLCGGISFSPSGRYLAIASDSSPYLPPVFTVWNIAERRMQFRVTDLSIIGGSANGGGDPLWGADDKWVALPNPAQPGRLFCLNPNTGSVVQEYKTIGGNYTLNRERNKLLFHVNGGLFDPTTCILDLKNNDVQKISLKDCVTGREFGPLITSWTAAGYIIIIGWGWVRTADSCENDISVNDPNTKQNFLHRYHIVLIDPSNNSIKKTVNFSGLMPEQKLSVNFLKNIASFGPKYILSMYSLSIRKLKYFSDGVSEAFSDWKFSLDGKYLYLAVQNPRQTQESVILDVVTGEQVGAFPGAWQMNRLSLREDGKYLALARDLKVEIHRLF